MISPVSICRQGNPSPRFSRYHLYHLPYRNNGEREGGKEEERERKEGERKKSSITNV